MACFINQSFAPSSETAASWVNFFTASSPLAKNFWDCNKYLILFLSGCGFCPIASDEFGSESVYFLIRSPWIRYAWIWKEKVADSKISGYVWAVPENKQYKRKISLDTLVQSCKGTQKLCKFWCKMNLDKNQDQDQDQDDRYIRLWRRKISLLTVRHAESEHANSLEFPASSISREISENAAGASVGRSTWLIWASINTGRTTWP